MTIYLDLVENRAKKFVCLQDYISTEQTLPELRDWFNGLRINNAPKPKPRASLAKVPGYQAADFLAWETRKYVHTDPQDERYRKELDGLVHAMDWPPARRRKSLHALNEAAAIRGTLWDVEVLENEHAARGGIWAPRDA